MIALGFLVGGIAIVGVALHYLRRVARQQELALRANEERYRLIAERSTDLIAAVDQEGCIHYASPSFQPTLGYDPARIIGQLAFTHMHPHDIAETTTRLAPAFTDGGGQAIFRFLHADGVWRWIEAQSSPLFDTDQPAAMIVGRDITERKRFEAELYHLQRLHGLGRLTSGVVHDFNNLLTGIAGFAELGLHALPSGHAIREDLEEIRGIAARAAALASHLLAFVRKQSMEPHLIDLNDVVRNLDKLLRRLLGADIEFVNLISKDELAKDYVVPPLEGLWWAENRASFTTARDKSAWDWTMMIMLPDWISAAVYQRALGDVRRKKELSGLHTIRMEQYQEGLSAQILHTGSYDDEAPVLTRLHQEWIPQHGYVENGKHHEVYLSDARRVEKSKLKTVLRQPIRKV